MTRAAASLLCVWLVIGTSAAGARLAEAAATSAGTAAGEPLGQEPPEPEPQEPEPEESAPDEPEPDEPEAEPSADAEDLEGERPGRLAWMRGRWELTIGGGRWGSSALGTVDARLAADGVPEGGDFRLFRTTTRIASTSAFEMALGFQLWPAVSLEAGLGLAQPQIRTTVTADEEIPDTVVVTDRMTQLMVDGSLVVRVLPLGVGRVVPFVRGGAGYVRQAHEGRRLIDTGHALTAGAGAILTLVERPASRIRGVGLRAEVRRVWYRDTFELEDPRAAGVTAAAGLTVRF